MYVVGTAGHVDHGKSLLVERLTGIDPDRLREEKQRGMTIDLGFAWLTLPSGRSVSIVDVPGHERFIKNMLAGAGGIDLALLVVAADDGVMPQTREHLAILDLLGVSSGVVAMTKRDLAEADWREVVRTDIAEALAGTTLAGSPIVECSSVTGDGIDELLRVLDSALERTAARTDRGRPRLPIDRVFTIDGFGTVVTGTLIDGRLAVGDEIEVLPDGGRGRVRGLQSHKDAIDVAQPGARTAVNVTGIRKEALRRGQVLTAPGAITPVTAVDARLRSVTGARPVRHNANVTFHTGADETLAQVRLLDTDEVSAGAEAWAQIRLSRPIAAVRGDHFVIRSPNETLGGGVIVDINPRRHRRRDEATLSRLAQRINGSPEDLIGAAIAQIGLAGIDELRRTSGLSPQEAVRALDQLVAAGEAVRLGEGPDARYVGVTTERALHSKAVAALGAFHHAHALRAGMPIEELRTVLGAGPREHDALLASWPDVRVVGAVVRLDSFAPALSPAQQQTTKAFLDQLAAAEPPGAVPAGVDSELRSYLVASGAVVDAGDGVLFEGERFKAMVETIRDFTREHESVTLAEARTLLGTNRRFAQAFLEHLDRLRLTRRLGDARVWRQDDSSQF